MGVMVEPVSGPAHLIKVMAVIAVRPRPAM